MSSRRVTGRHAIVITLAVLAVGGAPFVLAPYPLALLTLALAYGLFAFGLDIAWGRAGVISIGHAAFFGIGGYGAGIAQRAEIPVVVGAAAGVAVATLVAIVIGWIGLQRRASASTMAILTLALTLLCEQVARSWIPVTGGSNGLFVSSSGLIPDFYTTGAVVLVVVVAVWVLILRGAQGRRFLAVASNAPRAAHLGIPVRGTSIVAFALSAAIAAVAGAVAAPVMGLVTPGTTGIMLSAQVLVLLAVGGRGTILGAFVGAILITMGEQYLGAAVGSWYLLILGVVFLLVVRFAPGGLVGMVRRMLRRPDHEAALQGAYLPASSSVLASERSAGVEVDATGVTKSFGATSVLRGIDFHAAPGDVVCIIGPNGAGKTTFLNIVAGDIPGDGGTVRIGGEDASTWPIHRRAAAGLGKVFQVPSVFADLSPADNIALARSEALAARPLPGSLVRFEDDGARPAKELPLADLRALELALALAWGPSVVILDEPAAGLSHEESIRLARLLREASDSTGSTLIVIEHDMEIVRELADRVVVLADGRVLTEGSLDEVSADGDVQRAYLGVS